MLKSILGLYNIGLSAVLVKRLRASRFSGWRLLGWFWHTRDFAGVGKLGEVERSIAILLAAGMCTQVAFGVGLLIDWARYGTAGAWALGVALLVSYPIVWAHVVVAFAWAWNLAWLLAHPKKAARSLVCTVLEAQVRQLRLRHKFKVVAVAGSVGKTSTKMAVADLLAHTGLRVRYQTGNYNDRVTVPLVFFGLNEPSLYNIFAWFKVFGVTQSEIALPYPYDVVVVELGTDGPGYMAEFAYVKPDITVVTGIAAEHMEYFGTLGNVAAEELTVFEYSKRVLVNGDDIAGEYLAGREFAEYSLASTQATYSATTKPDGLKGQKLALTLPGGVIEADVRYVGLPGAKFATAATGVADMLGVKRSAIAAALPKLLPFSGRMQILDGIKNTTIIDDTYNASPVAVKAALDALYGAKTPQRIAILGSMNELGDYSPEAHREVGEYCDPKKLDVVITIGHDAKKWLAPIARKRGCTVHAFLSPYEAGAYVSGKMREGAVVLAKGSQNGVFAEEAIKPLLADPTDAEKLVRQSPYWMTRKAQQFPA